MNRLHTCDDCGHYTWGHGKHGCVTIIYVKAPHPLDLLCCPCLKTFPDSEYTGPVGWLGERVT